MRSWLRTAGALALAGVALSGCGQLGGQKSEYLITKPTQTDHGLIAATMQRVKPAGVETLEPEQALDVPSTAADATATHTPVAPERKGDTVLDSKVMVEKAKADLAHMLGIPANDIDLVVVIGQEFTSDGFYCRLDKGRTSKEEPTVMIFGEAILLKAQGNQYEYHADSQQVIYCRMLP